jgi:hypothetical protein
MNPYLLTTLSVLGMALSLYLFLTNYYRRDGFGRLFLLIYTGSFFMYFIIRFSLQYLCYCVHVIERETLLTWVSYLYFMLFIPLIAIIIIEHYYRRRK